MLQEEVVVLKQEVRAAQQMLRVAQEEERQRLHAVETGQELKRVDAENAARQQVAILQTSAS
jgi:formylmethanofuran dehydrogenase subunit B